jgi:hypothetical protein
MRESLFPPSAFKCSLSRQINIALKRGSRRDKKQSVLVARHGLTDGSYPYSLVRSMKYNFLKISIIYSANISRQSPHCLLTFHNPHYLHTPTLHPRPRKAHSTPTQRTLIPPDYPAHRAGEAQLRSSTLQTVVSDACRSQRHEQYD